MWYAKLIHPKRVSLKDNILPDISDKCKFCSQTELNKCIFFLLLLGGHLCVSSACYSELHMTGRSQVLNIFVIS